LAPIIKIDSEANIEELSNNYCLPTIWTDPTYCIPKIRNAWVAQCFGSYFIGFFTGQPDKQLSF